jgi:Domain of unknown function (DUF4278)
MKLIYRGNRFNIEPGNSSVPKASTTTNHELIYRGQTYRYDRPVIKAYAIKAVNWRFAAVCHLPVSNPAIA